jgi:hypothetical protein
MKLQKEVRLQHIMLTSTSGYYFLSYIRDADGLSPLLNWYLLCPYAVTLTDLRTGPFHELFDEKQLSSWNWVRFEKLIFRLWFKKFSLFYGIRQFITAFRSVGPLALSTAHSNLCLLKIQFSIILPCTTTDFEWSLSLRYPYYNPVCVSSLSSYVLRDPPI